MGIYIDELMCILVVGTKYVPSESVSSGGRSQYLGFLGASISYTAMYI